MLPPETDCKASLCLSFSLKESNEGILSLDEENSFIHVDDLTDLLRKHVKPQLKILCEM